MIGYLKNRHEPTLEEYYTGKVKFENEFNLVTTPVYGIDENGNIISQGNTKLHLEKDGIQLTRDYWNIIELWDDQYVVCDINVSDCYLENINQDIMDEIESLSPKFKFQFGVIKLQRDNKGKVIPFTEKTIIPIIYDRISENNEDSLTAYINGKLTYIDLNPESSNYGKQIVPAVLDYAVPFSVQYDGFAECGVNGVTGYLPRNCSPRKKLESSDLLTEDEVQYLLQKNNTLDATSTNKLSKLTGSSKVLKLTKK